MENPFPELARRFVDSSGDVEDNQIANEAARFLQVSETSVQSFNDFVTAPRQYIQGGDNEDQITRAKGYGFLAATIGCLPKDFLTTRQVNFLVPFFVSVFRNDVRGGVKAATQAITFMRTHNAFTSRVAIEVLEGIPKLGDDFRKQEIKTRQLIYKLIQAILMNSEVIQEVERTYGQNISFFRDLLDMVQIERDAGCLIIWLKIIETFLALYNPAPELTKDIFELFSASYFPISIKNTATPSGITTQDMKKALRNCFTAHNRVAEHAFPFLLEKLNAGDVAKAEVKLDILQTLDACIKCYTRVDNCIVPHIDAIWTNLRFEVRNGEVESTIAATIDVLRSLAKKLSGTDLVRYCSSVQQDCVDDLRNNNFTAQAGKLLLSALSAKPESFGIMLSPTMASVINELRHASSEKHTQKLLSLADSIMLIRTQLYPRPNTDDDYSPFVNTQSALVALYTPLRQIVARSFHANADDDTLLTGSEAAKALANLISQEAQGPYTPHLIHPVIDPESVITATHELLDKHIWIINHPDQAKEPRRNSLQVIHDDLLRGLTRAAAVQDQNLILFLNPIFAAVHTILEGNAPGWERSAETLLRDAASIATDIPMPEWINVSRYETFASKLLFSMELALKAYNPDVWTFHIVAAQEAFIYMMKSWEDRTKENGCPKFTAEQLAKIHSDPRFEWDQWVPRLRARYTKLPTIQDESAVVFKEDTGMDEMSVTTVESFDSTEPGQRVDQALADIHRIGLYIVREVYRSITHVVPETQARALSTNTRFVAIELVDMFSEYDKDAEDKFLVTLSQYAKAVVSKLHVRHQMDLFLADEVIGLFHSNEIVLAENFKMTRKTSHIADVEGHQVRDCLMSPPDERLEEMLSEERKNLRCPPLFPINGLNRGRILTLSYGILAALQSFPNSGAPGSIDGAFDPWINKYIAHRLLIAGLLGREHPEDPVVEGYLFATLASLGNKFQVESMPVVSTMIPTYLKLLADPVLQTYTLRDERFCLLRRDLGESSEDSSINKQGRIQVARRVLAVLAGMLRRPKSRGQQESEMSQVWTYVEAAPRDRNIGHNLARAMEVLFTKNDALKPELHSHITPLWLQRAYSLFVDSWITSALPTVDDNIAATNCTIAALGALVNMPMAIWESRTSDIVKMCLCVMTSLPMGPDLARAVQLLKTIHDEEPAAIAPFLDSVIVDCVRVLRMDDDRTVPDWLPSDFQTSHESRAAAGHVSLACVRLLGALALKQDRAKLRPRTPMVCRELRHASSMSIREVRSQTIKARQAWEDVHYDRPARE